VWPGECGRWLQFQTRAEIRRATANAGAFAGRMNRNAVAVGIVMLENLTGGVDGRALKNENS
jgi:hypothetical protein